MAPEKLDKTALNSEPNHRVSARNLKPIKGNRHARPRAKRNRTRPRLPPPPVGAGVSQRCQHTLWWGQYAPSQCPRRGCSKAALPWLALPLVPPPCADLSPRGCLLLFARVPQAGRTGKEGRCLTPPKTA